MFGIDSIGFYTTKLVIDILFHSFTELGCNVKDDLHGKDISLSNILTESINLSKVLGLMLQ